MTQPNTELGQGAATAGVGVALSTWSWLAGEANGFTIILTVVTIVLTVMKVIDAARAWRSTKGTVRQRWRQMTRPEDFDTQPHHHEDKQ